jgi:hypothetical protein
LLKLIKEWDQKLKDSGFKDVESRDKKTGELRLTAWDSHYFQIRNTPEIFEIKQEYYYKANQFLSSYRFVSHTERHIWEMHSSGFGVRQIADDLKAAGIKTNKDYVATIVTRLKKAMREATKCESEI